jgi:hypothetical protein
MLKRARVWRRLKVRSRRLTLEAKVSQLEAENQLLNEMQDAHREVIEAMKQEWALRGARVRTEIERLERGVR